MVHLEHAAVGAQRIGHRARGVQALVAVVVYAPSTEHLGVRLERVLVARHGHHARRAEPGIRLRADVVVVGDGEVVEAAAAGQTELLAHGQPDRVRVVQAGVVVAGAAVGVVRVGGVHVQVTGEPDAGVGRARTDRDAGEYEHGTESARHGSASLGTPAASRRAARPGTRRASTGVSGSSTMYTPGPEVRRRLGDRVRAAAVDHVVAQRARVPGAVGVRVVADVAAVARPRAGRDRVPDVGELVLVDERDLLPLLDGRDHSAAGRGRPVAGQVLEVRDVDEVLVHEHVLGGRGSGFSQGGWP